MRRRVAAPTLALLSLAACKHAAKAPAVDCAAVERWQRSQLAADVQLVSERLKPVATQLLGKSALYFRERCEQDRWSPAAIACIVASRSNLELGGCRGFLSFDQREELRQEGYGIGAELSVQLQRRDPTGVR